MKLIPSLLFALAALFSQHAQSEPGISKDTIIVGRSAGMTGTIASRMKPVTEAMQAYFDHVNSKGGIYGRKIQFINLDDGNDPKRAAENTRKLVEEKNVFTLFAQSGTPQTQAVMPIVLEREVPLVGTSSGAESLRKPNKFLFHLKASYGDEFFKVARHMKTIGINRIAVVYSDDGTGQEGSQLAQTALQQNGVKPLVVVGLKPNDAKAAVEQVMKAAPQAVILASLAGPAAGFYKEFVKVPNRPQVFTWSIVAVENIYKEVGADIFGLIVTQVFPSPANMTFGMIRDYNAIMKAADLPEGGYPGLEGYISARILVEGLRRAGNEPTRAKLLNALQSIQQYDLGGDFVTFNDRNVGRTFVELTLVGRDGRFLR